MTGFIRGLIGRRIAYGRPSRELSAQFMDAARIGRVEVESEADAFVVRIGFWADDYYTAEGRDADISKAMQKALDQAEEFLS